MKGTTSTSAIFRRMGGKITIALLFDDENGLRAYDRKVGYSGPNRTDLFVFVLNHSEPATPRQYKAVLDDLQRDFDTVTIYEPQTYRRP